ncbi:MAG: hypothetical protein ABIL58_21250 [Pseudomonadota bacterium]
MHMSKIVGWVTLFSLIMAGMVACAGIGVRRPIESGERLSLDFTCRLADGRLAASTDPTAENLPKSDIAAVFRTRKAKEPLIVTAGSDEKLYRKPGERGFEGEIVAQLAAAAVGGKPGEARKTILEAPVGQMKPNERLLEMAKVRIRPKQFRMNREEYRMRTGGKENPVVGDEFTIDPSFPGKVTGVTDTEVIVVFDAEIGKTVETPLGQGIIRDGGIHYEIVIDAKAGDLVRSGAMVGRIIAVEERSVTIDYGSAFGGEKLFCDYRVERAEKEEKKE